MQAMLTDDGTGNESREIRPRHGNRTTSFVPPGFDLPGQGAQHEDSDLQMLRRVDSRRTAEDRRQKVATSGLIRPTAR